MGKLVAVVGQTASGKSELAMELARKLSGEIICADSWTVYKGFDIGTAKPSLADREEIPHHLLDVADPAKGFNVATFQKLARDAIKDIEMRQKLPIIVGGSGLYIDSLLYDYSFLPPSDPRLREELNQMSVEELQKRAYAQGLDSEGIDMKNKRRVIRLIENGGIRATKKGLLPGAKLFGILREKDELKSRIESRIDDMIEQGFVAEVARLGEQFGWGCEPMRAPGYRAFVPYVQGKTSLDEAKKLFVQNDLKLAKKQRTWFKRNTDILWLNNRGESQSNVDFITTVLNKL